ncbi:hypothetical protein ACPPVU_03500 [Mucilaginibacter sp. McL0603]|uniref:hypothetical protein n=1 Tax=Mucilaginibacter sp. McL0603 TaxID=3415670 RepID=UPI003CF2002B
MNSFRSCLIYLVIMLCLISYSCSKAHNTPVPSADQQTDVYVSGVIANLMAPGIFTELPVYYKNGISHSLSNTTAAYCGISAFTVVNNDIYAYGVFNKSMVFWKNNTQQPFANSDVSLVTGIAMDGNNTYLSFAGANTLAGSTVRQTAGYTLNNNTLFEFTGSAYGIVSSGTDIYCFGDTAIATPDYSPSLYATYYKNKIPVHLSDIKGSQQSVITSMFISGNDVYASGYVYRIDPVFNSPIIDTAVYWKNGAMTVLQAGGYVAHTTAIAVKGNDVYVAGYINNGNWNSRNMDFRLPHATLWKNGVPVTLSKGAFASYTNNMVLSGNDVYVGGTEGPDSAVTLYWKNGTPVTLKLPATSSFGETGIQVVTK